MLLLKLVSLLNILHHCVRKLHPAQELWYSYVKSGMDTTYGEVRIKGISFYYIAGNFGEHYIWRIGLQKN